MSFFVFVIIIGFVLIIIVSYRNRTRKQSCLDNVRVASTETLSTTERLVKDSCSLGHSWDSVICIEEDYILNTLRLSPEFKKYSFSPVAKNYSEVKTLLAQCFSARQAVIIDYETENPRLFEPRRKIRAVEIYALGSNYFEAYCYYRKTIRTFRFDRVRGAMPTDRAYSIPANFEPGKWVRR